jgi:hypothetical protein
MEGQWVHIHWTILISNEHKRAKYNHHNDFLDKLKKVVEIKWSLLRTAHVDESCIASNSWYGRHNHLILGVNEYVYWSSNDPNDAYMNIETSGGNKVLASLNIHAKAYAIIQAYPNSWYDVAQLEG